VSLEAGGGIPCRPNPAATLLIKEIMHTDKVMIGLIEKIKTSSS